LVSELLDRYGKNREEVLDPFCGTGTTALACAERGIPCDTTDINPFLIWLAQTKTRPYSEEDLEVLRSSSSRVLAAIRNVTACVSWLPSLYQIDKWWDQAALAALGRAMHEINILAATVSPRTLDLLKIAFCRVAIEQANVSFGHQSMSFRTPEKASLLNAALSREESIAATWEKSVASIATAAASPISAIPRALLCDARALSVDLEPERYSCVITSPPYPNRMSYIRELRPYLYWLGYLTNQRDAGELDWQAIGGTWGCATSNVAKWQPPSDVHIPYAHFDSILARVAKHSELLSRYIHKYFYDMVHHCKELFRVVRPGGIVNYIVGNSKFYEVVLPVEAIYASMFEATGFNDVQVNSIRKRTSKKELFEFVVSATRPN
jgi:hypothetical protein